eukprot:854472-Amphidinium_carterae.1
MSVKWSGPKSGEVYSTPGEVEYNSRTNRIVRGKYLTYAPAHIALATLLYSERHNASADTPAVRKSRLAAKAASVLMEHFWNKSAYVLVRQLIEDFDLEGVRIDWDAEMNVRKRIVMKGP